MPVVRPQSLTARPLPAECKSYLHIAINNRSMIQNPRSIPKGRDCLQVIASTAHAEPWRQDARADERWEWQWLFPAREASRDPTSGIIRRHHTLDGAFQNAVRKAATAAGINKRVAPHVLRHTFATRLLDRGTDFRTAQGLPGHADIRATQICLRRTKRLRIPVR